MLQPIKSNQTLPANDITTWYVWQVLQSNNVHAKH